MEVRLLGPVELWTAGGLVNAGPPRQRCVLAALAADAGRPVPAETLVDRVWGTEPPNRVRQAVYVYITHIRGLMASVDPGAGQQVRVIRRSGGYLLDIEPDRVDVHRFGRLVRQSREPSGEETDRVTLLRQAMDLWRGAGLADLSGQWAARMRQVWEGEYLDAAIAWAHAVLRAGDAGAAVSRLTELAERYPLNEALAAALMRVLNAAGRGAEALGCFARTRQRLARELGTDPGGELQRLHRAILRGSISTSPATAEPAATVPPAPARVVLPRPSFEPVRRAAVPAQLPADAAAFTGRETELTALDDLLARRDPTAVVISVVSGTAGVGKTALAVRWAHRVRGQFPDGQLYVNMRGFGPDQPETAAEALARFLAALGLAREEIPFEAEERAARYRTEIADRRMLIVLDNAASVEQVRPLLPGTPACTVLVTSRDSLAGLVAGHGAHRLDLDLLPHADAMALLRRLIGPRLDTESDDAAILVGQCARLPLALRVAAELVAAHPTTSLGELTADLADQQHRLDLLDAGGDPRIAVGAVFSWSIRYLPSDAARMFQLLGLHPGPDLDAYAAAALAGTALLDARRVLHVLARAHLVHHTGPGRYGMHDLLRAYATTLATAETSAVDRRAALDRLFDFYLATAADAATMLFPGDRQRRPEIKPPGTPTPTFLDPDSASAWLDTERGCLAAMAAFTATRGWPSHCVRLSTVLRMYLVTGLLTDMLAIHGHARDAAAQAGDPVGHAEALFGLAGVYYRLGRWEQAIDHVTDALALFRQVGDQVGEGRAFNSLGVLMARLGRYQTALGHVRQALAAARQNGDLVGEVRALVNVGVIAERIGRYEDSFEPQFQALELARRVGDRFGEGHALNNLGVAEERLGRYEAALGYQRQALAVLRQAGDRSGEGWALDGLGTIHHRLGRPDEASEYLTQALTIFRALGFRAGEASALNGLGETAFAAGSPRNAFAWHGAALAVANDTEDKDQQTRAYMGLGHAYRALGDPDSARQHYARALEIWIECGAPGTAARMSLEALDNPELADRNR